MYQSFHRLFRKNYHKTACSVLQLKHLDILIWIYSHIQDAWFVEFSVLSFSYIQIHLSYFGIHTNVPSHICISHNQAVPVLEITSFSFTSFVIPSRKFPVLSVPVSCRYQFFFSILVHKVLVIKNQKTLAQNISVGMHSRKNLNVPAERP